MSEAAGTKGIPLAFAASVLVSTSSFAQDQHGERFQRLQVEGIKQLQSQNYSYALELFGLATKEHSESWQTWHNIAICQLRLGQYKETLVASQKSIKLSGGLHSGHCLLMSSAYEGLGHPRKAYAWLALACKVDPTKTADPIIKNKLKLLSDPMQTPSGKDDAHDYFEGLVSSQKWHVADFPIKVFIRKNREMPEYYEQFKTAVLGAIRQWCNATDNKVSFKSVDTIESANLIFDYTKRREEVSVERDLGSEGSALNRIRFDDHSISWSNITVLVKDSPEAALFRKTNVVTKSLLHEIGHALGMHGHSPNPNDVMFAAATPNPDAILSKRDINTIRKIYDLPVVRTN